MNINGICYIAKKYQSEEPDFTKMTSHAGKVWAYGKIVWCDKSKAKDGSEVKSYTNKSFSCFDARTIEVLEACVKDLLVIDGRLTTESFVTKDGEEKKAEKIRLNSAKRWSRDDAQATDTPQEIKAEIKSQFNTGVELDDDIPF